VPRKNRRRTDDKNLDEEMARRGLPTVQTWAAGEWYVRAVSADAAIKSYRCPGCDHDIGPRVAHTVAWPADADPSARRHWHTPCWNARDRRSPLRFSPGYAR
jgi:hypothetical protein